MNIVAALLIFTVIVVFHEFGHFLLAKKNGVEVTEFSVGMGPRFITFAKTEKGLVCKLFCSGKVFEEREDWKEVTKYSWKLLPIGGSCAMVGEDMEDSSEGSFNSKGVWVRFSIIFAGPFFNFILAFVFAVIILANAGVDVPQVVQVYHGQPGETAGIEVGDTIQSINGHHISIGREIDTYLQLHPLTQKDVKVVVERDGKEQTITYNPAYETYMYGFGYAPSDTSTAEISSITEGGAFAKAGIQTGDIVVSVNGTKVSNGAELENLMESEKSSGNAVDFVIKRAGKEKEYTVKPDPYAGKSLGFYASKDEMMGAVGVLKYSVIEVKYWIETTVAGLGQLIGGKLSKDDISGPVGIVDAVGGVIDQSVEYGAKAVIINMLYMSVLLSANLGVMNLLPFPALDGGRIVFIVLEAIRRKPVDREKEGFVNLIGFVILMAFMVFVMFNDILKLVK